MDFRHLEYFCEIAKENNVTKAAANLYVSQSAVNQYLLKLEKELGTQLFVRNHRNWKLTQAGEIYLEGCRKALLIRDDTYNAIQDLVDSRASSLTIGLTPTRGLTMFTEIFPELMRSFPGLKISPIEMSAMSQQRASIDGTIDLGFLLLAESQLDSQNYIDLGEEEIILVVPVSHPLCSTYQDSGELPTISLRQLKDFPFALTRQRSTFRGLCDRMFEKAGFDPEILMETSNTAHVTKITETGQCCGLIPYYYADTENPHYRCFRLKQHPVWHLYILHREEMYLTKAEEEFIRLSRAYWKKHIRNPASDHS